MKKMDEVEIQFAAGGTPVAQLFGSIEHTGSLVSIIVSTGIGDIRISAFEDCLDKSSEGYWKLVIPLA